MVSSILLLFSDPDGFFRHDPADWSRLAVPAAIVLVSGILAAPGAYLASRLIAGLLPEGMAGVSGMAPAMGIAAAGGALAWAFIGWVAYTAIFYVISMIFMGKGTFRRVLAAVGYGFLPTAIDNLITLLLLWYSLPGIPVSPVKDVLDIQTATLALTHSTVFQMTGAIGTIFLAWSASIWIFGLRSSRELSLRNAAITVGIPVLVSILVTLVSLGVIA
jgi:hypothetical protein